MSFTLVGVTLASASASLGLDPDTYQSVAAAMLVAFGAPLLSARLQERFAVVTSGTSSVGHRLLAPVPVGGLPGQFALGLLLGIVWSPCAGPTLGAAVTLGSQEEQLAEVTLVTTLFGLGASLPLVLLGFVSRGTAARCRGRLLTAGHGCRLALGSVMLVPGTSIFTGPTSAPRHGLGTFGQRGSCRSAPRSE